MRRPAAVLGVLLLLYVAACSLRHPAPAPSRYCRGGSPTAGVYHPQRLKVKSRCRVAIGTGTHVNLAAYGGEVDDGRRPDTGYERRLSCRDARGGGSPDGATIK